MKTIVVAIENKNSLSPTDWLKYSTQVDFILFEHAKIRLTTYTRLGFSAVSWIVDCDDSKVSSMKDEIRLACKFYGQDSTFWMEGTAEEIRSR